MPDVSRKTVSATEIGALFGESPYLTRWMLYHAFVSGQPTPTEENERMVWGRKLQPLIAEQAAQDHGFVVEQNDEQDRYVSRGVLGCTRDAIIVDPSRGPGALEIKCCFDYKVWMDKWDGGNRIPREIMIQIQQQMFVGSDHPSTHHVEGYAECGCHGSFTWGLLAVWVCAQMYYFKIDAQPDLWAAMEREASHFLLDVIDRREPDPVGSVLELPLLAKMYPTVSGKVLDWREETDAHVILASQAATYLSSKATENAHKKVAESLRAGFIAIMKDHETLLLPGGGNVRLSTDSRGSRRIQVWQPEER